METPSRQVAKRAQPSPDHNRVAKEIVDSASAVHSALGAGLLESVYEHCLVRELRARQLVVERQIPVPIIYRGTQIDAGFRLDLLVHNLIVVEIKAVERLVQVHEAQLMTYLRLSGNSLGFLINFNVPRIKDGLRRIVNSH
jgi:GxxExxY protein